MQKYDMTNKKNGSILLIVLMIMGFMVAVIAEVALMSVNFLEISNNHEYAQVANEAALSGIEVIEQIKGDGIPVDNTAEKLYKVSDPKAASPVASGSFVKTSVAPNVSYFSYKKADVSDEVLCSDTLECYQVSGFYGGVVKSYVVSLKSATRPAGTLYYLVDTIVEKVY